MARTPRPVVGLDIDGVCRPAVPRWLVGDPALDAAPPLPAHLDPGSRIARWFDRDAWRADFTAAHGPDALAELDAVRPVTLRVSRAQWPTNPFHSTWQMVFGGPDGVPETADFEVLLLPWIGDWVNGLLGRGVQVVWSTTWADSANTWIGPVLGIPRLEWGQDGTTDTAYDETITWKVRGLGKHYPGRPIAVIDDQPWRRSGVDALELEAAGEPVASLVVRVDEVRGLTRAQASEVDDWLTGLGW